MIVFSCCCIPSSFYLDYTKSVINTCNYFGKKSTIQIKVEKIIYSAYKLHTGYLIELRSFVATFLCAKSRQTRICSSPTL